MASGVYLSGRGTHREFTITLCQCACHELCPVTGQGRFPLKAWVASCTCTGAGPAREKEARRAADLPEFGDTWQSAGNKLQTRREAINSVRLRAAGKSDAEIRLLLADEFRSRKLTVPPGESMDNLVELIARPGGHLTAIWRTSRALLGAGSEIGRIIGMFRGAQVIKGPAGKDSYFVPPDHSRPITKVILDPGAEALLRAAQHESSSSAEDLFPVWLERIEAVGGEPGAVAVSFEKGQIGTLSADAGRTYDFALRRAQQKHQVLTVMGKCGAGPDGSVEVLVYPAGTSPW
jgi:hypothetical protein